MRAVLIHQNPKHRDALSQLVQTYSPHATYFGYAEDTTKGLELLQQTRPDLVFLSAELPVQDLLTVLDYQPTLDFMPVFLCRPGEDVHTSRTYPGAGVLTLPLEAVALLQVLLQRYENMYQRMVRQFVREPEHNQQLQHRLLLSNNEGYFFVRLKDLIRLEAFSNYCTAYVVGHPGSICVAMNLGEYIQRLKDVPFLFQTHRSHLVNLYHVKRLLRKDGGKLMVCTHNGVEDCSIPLTPDRKPELFRRMSQL